MMMRAQSLRRGIRRFAQHSRLIPSTLGASASTVDERRWVSIRVRNSLRDVEHDSSMTSIDTTKRDVICWYSCGPTVYDLTHLGHARTYVCTDIIRRILADYFKLPMNYALGITDIDDKIINRGYQHGMTTWSEMECMVRELEDSFFSDMDRLSVKRPDTVLRVTEHIHEIIMYISNLLEKKHAYVADDGVYFDFSSLPNAYDKFGCVPGDLSSVDIDSGDVVTAGAEPSKSVATKSSASFDEAMSTYCTGNDLHKPQHQRLKTKRNARDFALWKLHRASTHDDATGSRSPRNHSIVWESPWGPGRPGWHIECSAMTHSLFGDTIDIHSGGIDLKFPHHTNEIAQCESHNCSDHNAWVKIWLHMGHLHIEGRKMSKSLKNFITVREYFDQQLTNHPGDDFRLYCLQHKYHAGLTYSPLRVQEAAKYRHRVENWGALVRAAVVLASQQSQQQKSTTSTSTSSTSTSRQVDGGGTTRSRALFVRFKFLLFHKLQYLVWYLLEYLL
mmetsp:Transcript_12874/g.21399  ORF Transcript_12874/g.21399 Transcript_12874/m.21399 type:complete len:503 (+) Transcript_12874:22-1530(+)